MFGFDTDAPFLNTSYVNCVMYADDLVLISRSAVGLQGLIDKLSDYCKRCRMGVHKTKILKFSGNGHCCKTFSFYRENLIENVINYKYLGLGIQCFWHLVQRFEQFIYKRYKGTLLFK